MAPIVSASYLRRARTAANVVISSVSSEIQKCRLSKSLLDNPRNDYSPPAEAAPDRPRKQKTHKQTHNTPLSLYIYIYIYVCVYIYIYIHTIYIYTYMCVYIYIYIYKSMYMCVYISLSLYIYIYIYIDMHTDRPRSGSCGARRWA